MCIFISVCVRARVSKRMGDISVMEERRRGRSRMNLGQVDLSGETVGERERVGCSMRKALDLGAVFWCDFYGENTRKRVLM